MRLNQPIGLVFAAVLVSSSTLAADNLATTNVETFGDWTIRCFAVQSEGPCDMAQESTNQQTKQRLVVTSIAYAPATGRYAVTIVVPLGVQLPNGVIITRDAYRSKKLPFRRCEDDGCYVETALDPSVIAELSKTGEAKSSLTVTAFAGGNIALPLSLNGFTDAMAAMKRLAQEKTTVASK